MVATLIVALFLTIPSQSASDKSLVKWIRLLDEYTPESHQEFFDAAPDAQDSFEKILNDPNTQWEYKAEVYFVLSNSKIDQKRFLMLAMRDLLHEKPRVRWFATIFIGVAGSGAEADA